MEQNSWKNSLDVPNLKGDSVLYNSVDNLSVYSYADNEVFLDIVHYIEQFIYVYNRVFQDKKYKWIGIGQKILIQIENAMRRLERNVSVKYNSGQRQKVLTDFRERAELVLDIIKGYVVNIIREIKSC